MDNGGNHIVTFGCGPYIIAERSSMLWWYPLRRFPTNYALPTGVPVIVASQNNLALASSGSTVYVGAYSSTDAGVIYAVGTP